MMEYILERRIERIIQRVNNRNRQHSVLLEHCKCPTCNCDKCSPSTSSVASSSDSGASDTESSSSLQRTTQSVATSHLINGGRPPHLSGLHCNNRSTSDGNGCDSDRHHMCTLLSPLPTIVKVRKVPTVVEKNSAFLWRSNRADIMPETQEGHSQFRYREGLLYTNYNSALNNQSFFQLWIIISYYRVKLCFRSTPSMQTEMTTAKSIFSKITSGHDSDMMECKGLSGCVRTQDELGQKANAVSTVDSACYTSYNKSLTKSCHMSGGEQDGLPLIFSPIYTSTPAASRCLSKRNSENQYATSECRSHAELNVSIDDSMADSSGFESGYPLSLDTSPRQYSSSTSNIPDSLQANPDFSCNPLSSQISPRSLTDFIPNTPYNIPYAPKVHSFDYRCVLMDRVVQTRYITTVFEQTVGGIADLISDISNELAIWLRDASDAIGIACELQWSVPEKFRNHEAERRLKSVLHKELYSNNQRVLKLIFGTDLRTSPAFTSSRTNEKCYRNSSLNCFQGRYRRLYSSLLPFQHALAREMHKPYWQLSVSDSNDDFEYPNSFIVDKNPTKLDAGSVITLNIITISIVPFR